MRLRLVLALIALAITAGFSWLCIGPSERSSVTFDAYQRIEIGMTVAQVEEILGGPPRNESGFWPCSQYRSESSPSDVPPKAWWGPHVIINVTFDDQDKVCKKDTYYHDFGPARKPTVWDEIRYMLRW